MNHQIKVSIIIPCYNSEQYLSECLNSLIRQTLKEIEIVCINDCSTDKTMDILEKYRKKYSNIKIVNNEKNEGQGYSRNKGIELSQGKYIYFLDSDDFIEPDTLEKMYQKIENQKAYCLLGQSVAFSQNYENKKRIQKLNKWMYITPFSNLLCLRQDIKKYYNMLPCMACNKLYLKSFLIKHQIYFINQYCWHEDDGFWLKFLAQSPKVAFLDKYCYHYRVHKSSTCSQSLKNKKLHRFYCHKSLNDALEYVIKNNLCETIPFIHLLMLLNEATRLNYFYKSETDIYLKILNFKIFRIKYIPKKQKFLFKLLGIPLFYFKKTNQN